jgi:hypothetical protein
MPILKPDNVLDVAREPSRALDETSDDRFDRAAFARHALDLVRPPCTTVAICEGAARMRVESGRAWGKARDERWALLAIPARASRRAIALAVAELYESARSHESGLDRGGQPARSHESGPDRGGEPSHPRPYALDLLLA